MRPLIFRLNLVSELFSQSLQFDPLRKGLVSRIYAVTVSASDIRCIAPVIKMVAGAFQLRIAKEPSCLPGKARRRDCLVYSLLQSFAPPGTSSAGA